jgi:penicillin-binding protein 1B
MPDRKNVIRPDVAYIMDDILKDVINRGTAAQAQSWGFRNNPGKAAFAGKTGTSRDGWFAGFTPELVCVVYVGFDNGDDLGMKGSDSAMPVWADFMKEAIALHPEWNGDWAMPANIRKAEIDIRNGALIRELDATAEASPTPTPTPVRPKDPNLEQFYEEPLPPEQPEIYVTNVPAEFRRVELFVAGTVPNRSLLQITDEIIDDGNNSGRPTPSPTPLSGTWQDGSEPSGGQPPAGQVRTPSAETGATVTVMICPVTGMRATVNCPDKHSKSFRSGSEPKEFCTFHR